MRMTSSTIYRDAMSAAERIAEVASWRSNPWTSKTCWTLYVGQGSLQLLGLQYLYHNAAPDEGVILALVAAIAALAMTGVVGIAWADPAVAAVRALHAFHTSTSVREVTSVESDVSVNSEER